MKAIGLILMVVLLMWLVMPTHFSDREGEGELRGSSRLQSPPQELERKRAKTTESASPPDLEGRWQVAMSADGGFHPGGKTGMLCDLALEIARSGEPSKAVQLLLNDISPGLQRANTISFCLMHCRELSEYAEIFQTLTEEEDIAASRKSVGGFLAQLIRDGKLDEPINALELEFLEVSPNKVFTDLCNSLLIHEKISPIPGQGSVAKKILGLQFPPWAEGTVLVAVSSFYPVEAWEELMLRSVELKTEEERKLAANLLKVGPGDALTRFDSHPATAGLVREATRQWLKQNWRDPIDWFQENREILRRESIDAFSGEVALFAARKGDYGQARTWLESIENQHVRDDAAEVIWALEKKAVFAEVTENPEAFLGSIATGQSQHEDYWMKEGFKKWFSTSSDQANQWFEDNRGTLSSQQSQHIARAYAEVALEQGDVALAREWSARVVDPEFKQKLLNQIEARAQAGSE